MKKILFLLFPLLLVSCNETNVTSITYDRSFDIDLKNLLSSSPEEYDENLPFDAKGYMAPSSEHEDYAIVTLEISYKNAELNDIKIILVPFLMDLSSEIGGIVNVGYQNESFSLGASTNESERVFYGYRLSYLTRDKEDGLKVSFKSDKYTSLFSISANNFIQKDTI